MEYYSAWKRKEILALATTWVNLEAIMPSEVSEMQKQILYDAAGVPRGVQFIETRSRMLHGFSAGSGTLHLRGMAGGPWACGCLRCLPSLPRKGDQLGIQA